MDNELKERLLEKRRRELFISELDEATKTDFKELAKIYFGDSYGPTLKYLIDLQKALTANADEEVKAKVEILADDHAKLRAEFEGFVKKLTEEPKKEGRKMMNGKIR